MDAELLLKRRVILADTVFAELILWQLPRILPGSRHSFKYRLALISAGICVMRYDNEAGKGDHRHVGEDEYPYVFAGVDKLLKDFEDDVTDWIAKYRHAEGGEPE
jgi:hypothetical protein